MNKRFLIITEGSETEPNIFVDLFKKYGFYVEHESQIKLNVDKENKGIFANYKLFNSKKDTIIIAQGPRNRIRDLLRLYDNQKHDIERFFTKAKENFSGIFLIYDVDQTLSNDLKEAFNKFNNEQDGLLLVSSPCIEVLAHEEMTNITEISGTHLSKCYKNQINQYINNTYHMKTEEFILKNFEKISLKYLNDNVKELKSNNVMEHPQLIVDKINEYNSRKLTTLKEVEFHYRYFSTVVYVCFAYILGLTKQINNSRIIKRFLEKNSIAKEKANV